MKQLFITSVRDFETDTMGTVTAQEVPMPEPEADEIRIKVAYCSICGSDMGRCAHEKGKRYDGRLCCARLRGSPARRQSVPTFRDSWGRSARR